MPGGLIQIASYGNQDILLISNPQITFFKIVYRRYTNFSMEYIKESFNGNNNFGETLSLTLSKNGDLLHQLYLKIQLPSVLLPNINKKNNLSEINRISNSINVLKNNYQIFKNFTKILNKIIIDLINESKTYQSNFDNVYNLFNNIIKKYSYNYELNKISNINIITNINFFCLLGNLKHINNGSIIIKKYLDIYNLFIIDFNNFINNSFFNENNFIDLFNNFINNFKSHVSQIDNIFNFELNILNQKFDIENRNYLFFSWVNNLGHQIIKKIDIEIGGKVIDFHDKYSFLINQYRNINHFKQNIYNNMIGNIDILTTYDFNKKPQYELIIPLNFWFNKYSGLSLPCIFLRYHDIKINLELENLSKCCYFELDFDDPNFNIQDYIQLNDISIIANYIYLDDDERKKFGQYQHEYLIDQLQLIQVNDIINENINFEIPFVNPIRDLHWLFIDNYNSNFNKELDVFNNIYLKITNFSDINQINLNKLTSKYPFLSKNFLKIEFSESIDQIFKDGNKIDIINSIYYTGTYTILSPENNYFFINIPFYKYQDNKAFICYKYNKSIINNTILEFNGIRRFQPIDGTYFDLVTPINYYPNSIPEYCISSYSFSIRPTEFNPAGFFNFNEVNYATLNLKINNEKIIKNNIFNSPSNLSIRIYAYNYNILQLLYGRAVLALNI